MTEAMPFLQKYDITFLRPPTILQRDLFIDREGQLAEGIVPSGIILSIPAHKNEEAAPPRFHIYSTNSKLISTGVLIPGTDPWFVYCHISTL